MLNAFTLKLSVSLFLLFAVCKATAQSVFEGQVFDKKLNTPIQSVTVGLIKTKIVALTNQQGYFNIQIDNLVPVDTLVFSSVGYNTFKLAVADYIENVFVMLEPSTSELEEVVITNRKLKIERLRGFDVGDINSYPASNQSSNVFPLGYAKLFESKQENVLLTLIEIGRKIGGSNSLKAPIQTRFLVHVMDIDDQSGAPGKVIFTKKVHLIDKARWITIDLTKDNVVLSSNRFFVVIEWQRIPINEMVSLSNVHRLHAVKKNGKDRLEQVSQYEVSYQPMIIGYHRDKMAITYTKLENGKWKINKYDSKDGAKELALSVTVKY
jgi:hypothetical protein